MVKAVIYGRVSTQSQDDDRQKTSIEAYAKSNGYEVVKYFAEKSTGRSKAYERSEFKSLLAFIEKTDIKMILVDEVSRVGRLGGKTRMEIEELAEKGVNMFFLKTGKNTLKENGEVDYDTMLVIGIQADLAKREWDDTSYRIKNKLKESAKSGKIQGAKFKAYGFKGDEVTKMIKPVESEIEVIKNIFNWYDNGLSRTAIAVNLNATGVPTRYNQFKGQTFRGLKAESYTWSSRTVYRILTNRMLIGERHHLGELVHTFEPLIDKLLFERVQEKLKNRVNRPLKVIKNPNYLKGILYCGCGCGTYINIDLKKRVNSYKCLTKSYSKEGKAKPCPNPSINIDKLIDSLFVVLTEQFIRKLKNNNAQNKNSNDEKIEI
ncbi:MAG TPA: recombinase family protein, partial [Cyclobacteriaceae bacterium]|nr:recombinase family protein [Cyclobacteriaceae bacterium]